MERFVCIHGHFYQPPRDNPWLEDIEIQDSAYPYHDWNQRITAECYGPNAASRILDSERRIVDIVNNYSKISFNFGPTLLAWLERREPDLYRSILEADRMSRESHAGHGSAIAQAYSHMIMPLANTADKRTQIIWGIRDFEHRFKRKPEGMWLPETAVDLESLDLLAEQGIRFTILAQRQARRTRRIGEESWQEVTNTGIDPKQPYVCRLPSGRDITLFFYDDPIAHDLAFGGLLESGETFARRLASAFVEDGRGQQLVHIATDGESYGHHHRFGEMALSYCLHQLESQGLARLVNYGEYLEIAPPEHEAEVIENSSWSCVHGVERWRRDCGCNAGRGPGWHQRWREPLREALDWLRDSLARLFEENASPLLPNPWSARDDYIRVILDRSHRNIDKFLTTHSRRELSGEQKIRALKLLEAERQAMLMYTSCGWFFDEISGIETVQILRYAARAGQLAREATGTDLEENFLSRLEQAPGNLPDLGNGRIVYDRFVKPAEADLLRAGVHYAVSSVFEKYDEKADVYCFTMEREAYEALSSGKQKLIVGQVRVGSKITLEEAVVSFSVLHLGEHNLMAAAREFMGEESYGLMKEDLLGSFEKADLPNINRLFEKHFDGVSYSLWHLFRDEQRRILLHIYQSAVDEIYGSFRRIYGHYGAILQTAEKLRVPLPRPLATAAELVLNQEIRKTLEGSAVDVRRLTEIVAEIRRYSLEIDGSMIGLIVSDRTERLMENLERNPRNMEDLERISELLSAVAPLSLGLNLGRSQNIYFSLGKSILPRIRDQADSGDRAAAVWRDRFLSLGRLLKVRIE